MTREFEPFSFSEKGSLISSQYPDPVTLKETYRSISQQDQFGILRLLITEGIPFVYKSNPLAYEVIRSFLAERFHIHPKEIVLVGSARVGYSLSKLKWGNPFSDKSDLDFAIVSEFLFKAILRDFYKWINDIEKRRKIPINKKDLENWLENIDIISNSVKRGFVQTNLLPYDDNYPTTKKISSTIWLLKKKFSETKNMPNVPRSSVRIYANWKSFLSQLHSNFTIATK